MATELTPNGEFDRRGGEIGRADRELMVRMFRTFALAIHRRFKALGRRDPANPASPLIDMMSAAEWLAIVQEEWQKRKAEGE